MPPEFIQTEADAKLLEEWAKRVNLSSVEFNALTAIILETVKHRMQDFAELFMAMSMEGMLEEQRELAFDKANKKGLWEQ